MPSVPFEAHRKKYIRYVIRTVNSTISPRNLFIDTKDAFCPHVQNGPDINGLIALLMDKSNQSIQGCRNNVPVHQCNEYIGYNKE